MRTKVFMAGSLLALLLVLGSRVAFAQSDDAASGRHFASSELAADLAERLHLSADDIAAIRADLAAGKSIKQVLLDHDISLDQIRTALGSAAKQHHRLSNTELISLAKKMGLNPDDVQAEIESGKTLRDVLRDHAITYDKIRAAFGEQFFKKPVVKKQKR